MRQGNSPVKDGWYERRLSWFAELMDTMKVPAQTIEKELKEIKITESRLETIDQEEIVHRFRAFVDARKR
jgi:D-mannonate dehydratase